MAKGQVQALPPGAAGADAGGDQGSGTTVTLQRGRCACAAGHCRARSFFDYAQYSIRSC